MIINLKTNQNKSKQIKESKTSQCKIHQNLLNGKTQ